MSQGKRCVAPAVAAMLVFFAAACSNADAGESREFFAMDTLVSITVYSDDGELAKTAADFGEAEFKRIGQLSDRFSKESQISRVNQKAGAEPVIVDPDLYKMIKESLQWAEKTDGAFNIALGPVSDLWGFSGDHPRVPDQGAIEKALALCDYRRITLSDDAGSVYLEMPGMGLDLGAVAKGYATELVAKKFEELGIKSALINAGGNIYVTGRKPRGASWRIGIQHPEKANEIIGYFEGENTAAITSGDNQRYFTENGKKYHHIIDPKTGYPSEASSQVTVVSSSGMLADILSTSLFVMGHDRIGGLIEGLPEVYAVYAVKGKTLYTFGNCESFVLNDESGYAPASSG